MMPGLSASRVLLGAGALLALVTAVSILRVLMLAPPDPVRPSAETVEAVNISLPEASPIEAAQFVERPLFWASRRPLAAPEESAAGDAAEAEEAAPTATALDKAQLVGLYADGAGGGGAIVVGKGGKHRVAINESVYGWTLVEVTGDSAIFSGKVRSGEAEVSRELVLEHALAGPGGGQADAGSSGMSAPEANQRKRAARKAARKQDS